MEWFTHEKRQPLYSTGTTVRDFHYRKFPARCEQNLNLHRTRVQTLVNEMVQHVQMNCC